MLGRASLAVTAANAPSLKTLQFWYTSTNDDPRWACARRNVSVMCLRSMSCVRATYVASAPSANDSGLKGWSIEPKGVDFVTFPSSLVGEYWPLVKPYIWLLNSSIVKLTLRRIEWMRWLP